MAETAIPGFLDRLGDRILLPDPSAGTLEVLRLRKDLTADPEFERCLVQRVQQLTSLDHPGCARVRHAARLPHPDDRLAVMSEWTEGWRLSEILEAAESAGLRVPTSPVLFLLRQAVAAVAAVHAIGPDVSHGAIGPERFVVTPSGHLVLVEHVLGSALATLPPATPDRVWRDLRLAVPTDPAHVPFGQRSDILQVGLTALALLLGRPLRRHEYPAQLPNLLDGAGETKVSGARQPLGPGLRHWLACAVGLDAEGEHWTIADATRGVEELLSDAGGYHASPLGIKLLLQATERFHAVPAAAPAPVEPPPAPAPPAEEPVPEQRAQDEFPDDSAAPVVERTVPADAVEVVPSSVDIRVVADEPVPAESVRPAVLVPDFAPAGLNGQSASDDRMPVSSWAPQPSPLVDTDDMFLPPAPALSAPAPHADGNLGPGVEPALEVLDLTDLSWSAGANEAAPDRAGDIAVDAPAADHAPTPASTPVESSPEEAPAEAVPLADMLRVERSETPHRHVSPDHAASAGVPHARAAEQAPPLSSRPLFGASAAPVPRSAWERLDAGEDAKPSRTPWILAGAAVAVVALAVVGWLSFRSPAIAPASPAAAGAAAREHQPGGSPVQGTPAATREGAAPATAASRPSSEAEQRAGAAGTPASENGVAARGAVSVSSPVALDVLEGGQKLGTSEGQIPLAVGRHSIELVNEDLAFRTARTINVKAGQTVKVEPSLPRGTANINATPWAEVWIDGQKVGETPLGNVQLTIGSHQVQFRHPQLGEQTRTLTVTAAGVARLSVELKK